MAGQLQIIRQRVRAYRVIGADRNACFSDGHGDAGRGDIVVGGVADDLIPHVIGSGVRSLGDGGAPAGGRSGGRIRTEGILDLAAFGSTCCYKLLCLSAVGQCFGRRRGHGRVCLIGQLEFVGRGSRAPAGSQLDAKRLLARFAVRDSHIQRDRFSFVIRINIAIQYMFGYRQENR